MGRLAAVSVIVLAIVLAVMAACSDGTGPRPTGNSVGLIVSAPVHPLTGAAAHIAAPVVYVASASASVVYVSLPPESVPGGLRATITNQATGQSVTTDIVTGGFDPVPLAANVGNTVVVDITGTASFTPVRVRLNIAPDRPPQPVRTSPPSGGRDVPLNSIIVVVFSDPIDPATLTTGSVQLLWDTTPVAGTVRFADSSHLRVEFHPASLLTNQTAYRLHVSTAIRDVNGVALAAPLDVPFTAGGTPGIAATLVLSGLPCNVVVTAKDAFGSIATGYTGAVHFTATDPAAVLPPDYKFLSADGGTHTFALTLNTAGSQLVTATDLANSLSGGEAVTVDPTISGKPLYVTNENSHSVTVNAAGARCSVSATPTATIAGSNTGLNDPAGIAIDGIGRVYVANPSNQGAQSINIYAPGANGNVAPVSTLTGGSGAGGLNPRGIALDGAGRLYVANGGNASVNVYAAGATGNASPVATIAGINTGLVDATGVALDAAGSLYVSNFTGNNVLVYAAGASGNAAPTAIITGSNTGLNLPTGIAIDGAGRIYVANSGDSSITVYGPGAAGNARPVASIAGSITGLRLPRGIAVDGLGRLFVANGGNSSITVYAAGATGNVAPIATITAGLSQPAFVAFPTATVSTPTVSAASDVFAVGEKGTILHYDGTSWTPQTSGTASMLFGVWGSSGSDVFAVGDHGTVLHYDGTRWALQPTPVTSRLSGVWGSSDRDIFAVGDFGTILHFDGTIWTRQRRDTTTFLVSVWGSSGSNVFAVGSDGTILHYDGTGWITQRTDSAIVLYGVWGTSGTDVFAVGDSILHYDGTSWKPQRISEVFGVWGGSGNDVFAVGDYGSILHYDGTSWTLQACSYCSSNGGMPNELDGVWGTTSSDVFSVGMGGGIVHYDGNHWAVQTSGTTAYLWGIWGSSRTR